MLVNAASVSVQEPQNRVYGSNVVSVIFSCVLTVPGEESPSGFYYYLDGRPEVYFTPNFNGSFYSTSISGLSEGNHSLLVYVETWGEDNYFHYPYHLASRSELVKFNVITKEPITSSSPPATPPLTIAPVLSPSPTPTPSPSPSPTLEPTPSLAPTPSPSVAEFPNWITLILLAVAGIMIICLKRRKL